MIILEEADRLDNLLLGKCYNSLFKTYFLECEGNIVLWWNFALGRVLYTLRGQEGRYFGCARRPENSVKNTYILYRRNALDFGKYTATCHIQLA